ncbi:calcium-binding protein [Skermanella mucosa]|uniref:calcium-binding protein n=1 Tax=Skermanella mucosa TaxID=1789672 RepID=UPI002B209A73|nr:calcium-binding protein [Skermanella mucosa]
MRYRMGGSVIEFGSAGGDVIAAATRMVFDWAPAPGNSFEWMRYDAGDELPDAGSRPSTATGTVTFDSLSPALGFAGPPAGFRFDSSSMSDTLESLKADPFAVWDNWAWDPATRTLDPRMGYESGHNAWVEYAESLVVSQGYATEGGFRFVHHGSWVLRPTPDLIAFGGAGNDRLFGGTGNDTLYGEAGDDELHGGLGRSFLSGGSGNDRLTGGFGGSVMTGGPGADTFIFAPGGGADTVTDFDVLRDRLVFDRPVAEVLESAVSLGGSTLIDLGGGSIVHLAGVATEQLLARADTIFAMA